MSTGVTQTQTPMPDAWGYVRVSQESDTSLDAQKASIREHATAHELDLQTTRNDGQGTSGFDLERDEYRLVRSKIERGEIDAVVTRDRARLARDFDERLWLITTLRATGVHWHVVETGGRLHLEGVQRAGFECLHAMMDHYKKMVEIERSRQATADRIERGCYQGTPPFGLTFAADNCHLTRDPAEWDRLETILDGDGTVTAVAESADVSPATVTRTRQRGWEWYDGMLDEYGV